MPTRPFRPFPRRQDGARRFRPARRADSTPATSRDGRLPGSWTQESFEVPFGFDQPAPCCCRRRRPPVGLRAAPRAPLAPRLRRPHTTRSDPEFDRRFQPTRAFQARPATMPRVAVAPGLRRAFVAAALSNRSKGPMAVRPDRSASRNGPDAPSRGGHGAHAGHDDAPIGEAAGYCPSTRCTAIVLGEHARVRRTPRDSRPTRIRSCRPRGSRIRSAVLLLERDHQFERVHRVEPEALPRNSGASSAIFSGVSPSRCRLSTISRFRRDLRAASSSIVDFSVIMGE